MRAFDLAVELVATRIALERIIHADPHSGDGVTNLAGRLQVRINELKTAHELRTLGARCIPEMRSTVATAWVAAAEQLLGAFGDEERRRYLVSEIRRLRPIIQKEHPSRGRKYIDGIVAARLGIRNESGVRALMKTHSAAEPGHRIGLEQIEARSLKPEPDPGRQDSTMFPVVEVMRVE